MTTAATEVARWNEDNPIGTLVYYWRGAREGEPSGVGRIDAPAELRHGTPIGWIDNASGYVALTHIQAVPAGEEHEAELFGARKAHERAAARLRELRDNAISQALGQFDLGMAAALVEHRALMIHINARYAGLESEVSNA